ncbi:hypothetical protein BJV82DRAFT_637175 [Fennellomyces sp. T-0311]|nr:hypothetical protein BJV82DRAFT_637175 [Fennellomyces sp. T-0311]
MHQLRTLRWKTSTLSHNEFSLFLVIDRSPALETLDIFVSGEFSIPTELTGLKQLKYLSLFGYPHVNAYSPEKKAMVANFFNYLVGSSKLERIRFANVSVLGYRALMAIAAIPTLKTFDIHLASDLQDQELREFIEELGERAITSLTLHNASRLPLAVLKALAELPLLTKFSTQVTMYDEETTRICKDGLQHLFYTSPRLTSVSFEHHIKVEENGNPFTYD